MEADKLKETQTLLGRKRKTDDGALQDEVCLFNVLNTDNSVKNKT